MLVGEICSITPRAFLRRAGLIESVSTTSCELPTNLSAYFIEVPGSRHAITVCSQLLREF